MSKLNTIPNIEYDVNKRLESALPHHKKTLHLFKRVDSLDQHVLENYFDFKSGGDGDNGEMLMCLLDIYFEEMDVLYKDC